ncbi:MAG: response regulator transcription factor [Firmicutes bacterium]|nr:response regulator transcription factor [Bacillota bacterium]
MARLLIVDDEEKIRAVIKEYAVFNGYETDEAADGMQAVDKCSKEDYDLIIMDIMMPKLDGFTAVKQIRKYKDIPVIMLSARGEEYDKLHGFELGIDDYVVKPFSPKELMARCSAVLARKSGTRTDEDEVLSSDGIVVNLAARTLEIDGEKVEITLKEFEILSFLMKNKNIAISRERMLSDIWGYDFYGDDRTIDTHIKNLRNRLGKYRDKVITVRGIGYKFED